MDWVVFDMDDVLVSSRELLLNALNEHTGEQLTIDQWHDFTLTNVYKNLNQFELVDIFHKIQFIENGVLEAYAAETVKHIADQGFNVGILTARGWHQRGEELTWDFVKKHQMPVKKFMRFSLERKKKMSFSNNSLEKSMRIVMTMPNTSTVFEILVLMLFCKTVPGTVTP